MNAKPDSRGFTLVEVVISAALLSLMMMAITTLAVRGTEAQEYARRLNRSTEIAQDLMDRMRLELLASVKLFGDDTDGTEHLSMLDLVGAPPVLANSRLPKISALASIGTDSPADPITGNSLFFTRLGWSDRYRCNSGAEYIVDVYRWAYYYLTPEDGGPQPGRAIGLNLVAITSEPLIDGVAIDHITDPVDQAEVLTHLANGTADLTGQARAPAGVVWLIGADPGETGTFRYVSPASGNLSNSPSGRPFPWTVLRSENQVQGLLTYRHHSVVTIHSEVAPAARYGIVSLAGSGFPHGLEVQVVGPSSARQVLVHLGIASTNRAGMTAFADHQSVVDVRDL